MASTDLSSSRKAYVHTRVPLRQPLRCGLSILICSCLFAGAAQCRSRGPQDVAEAARQERARKEQGKKSKHVYTDEDLRRATILTPDDEARVEASRKPQAAPIEEQAQGPVDAEGALGQLPLGDIARMYRNAKLAAQAPDPFHLPFDEPTFAAPVISLPSVKPPLPSFAATQPNFVPARPQSAVAPALPSPAPSQELAPTISAPSVKPPLPSFAATQPNFVPARPQSAVAPALPSPAPLQELAPSVALPKVTRPATHFSTPRPNVASRVDAGADALIPGPAISSPAPAQHIGPAVSLPMVARPAMNFSAARPNVLAGRPESAVAPTLTNPAPIRRVDPFTRRIAPQAPPTVSRVAPVMPQPKAGTIVPVAPKSSAVVEVAPTAPATPTSGGPAVVPPAARVKVAGTHTIVVKPGDSLWKIAQQNLGRGTRWQELLAANPSIVDPTRIAAGTEIVMPAQTTGLKSDLKVTVKQGDTLSKIAQSTYRRAAAWRCIAQANPEIADANRIYAGQQLLLPFGCKEQ